MIDYSIYYYIALLFIIEYQPTDKLISNYRNMTNMLRFHSRWHYKVQVTKSKFLKLNELLENKKYRYIKLTKYEANYYSYKL